MVIAGAEQYTDAAISDVLAQTIPTKLLLIGQGLNDDFRHHLERICEANDEQVFGWFFEPQVSLSTAWNRGLKFVWECGADKAWILNNDTRVHRETAHALSGCFKYGPLLVSAVGVTPEQFDPDEALVFWSEAYDTGKRGGPDFSCFMVSKEAHEKYPFDEEFYPAFCEDLDLHRRMMLGGDAGRIFSVNVPYLHYSSQTLKTMPSEQRARTEAQITGRSRAHYERKWGGPVNQERYTLPFDPESAQDGVTTPELQRSGVLTEAGSASR